MLTYMDELTKKQRGFVKDYIETGNGVQSALNNYDTKDYNTANQIAVENLQKPTIQNAIKSIADSISDDKLIKVLDDGLEANRVISANITYGEADEKTNDFIEVPDHAVRHKYLDTALKLKGLYESDETKKINVLMPVLVRFLDKKDEPSDNGDTQ